MLKYRWIYYVLSLGRYISEYGIGFSDVVFLIRYKKDVHIVKFKLGKVEV
jgi:hypothetical protein